MKSLVLLLIIIISASFVSCKNNVLYAPDELVTIQRSIPIDTLKCDSIFLGIEHDTTDYYVCFETSFIGPYSVQITYSKKHRFQICDLRNPKKLVFFGNLGHANNEFIYVPEALNLEIAADSSMLIYCTDYGKNKVVCIDAEASYHNEKCVVRNTYDIPNRGVLEAFFPFYSFDSKDFTVAYQRWSYKDIRDNVFFSPKFILNGKNGETEKTVYPNLINTQTGAITELAYHSIFRMSPNRSKIVECLYHSDITNILDLKSGKVLGIVGNDEAARLDYFEKTNSLNYYNENIKRYTGGVALSNDKIFHIWKSGCLQADIEKDLPILEVLTYEGKLLGSFYLEKNYCSISYSEYYDCLFVGSNQDFLYKYELPQWLKKN